MESISCMIGRKYEGKSEITWKSDCLVVRVASQSVQCL